MRAHLTWIESLVFLGLLGWVGTATAQILPAERDALIALYNSTDGANWTNNGGWMGTAGTECTWFGVTCDGGGTTVIQLELGMNNLSGTIPPELGNLSGLRLLWLAGNQLSGNIPPELGNLGSLVRLYLSSNRLSGGIPPELGNLSSLNRLELQSNQLSGSIPPEVGNLGSLTHLSLYENQLSGSIPPELGNLGSLEALGLLFNRLSGSIPAELGKLGSLESLALGGNQLTGSMPAELGNLGNLTYLSLFENRLRGGIPPQLGNLSSLNTLELPSNQLSGSIPPELGNLGSLVRLYLSSNRLSGGIPPEFGNLSSLNRLELQSNQLSGSIPAEMHNLTSLVSGKLDLSWNALYTPDTSLRDFLNTKQDGGDWEITQTVAPGDLAVTSPTTTSLTLEWSPIAYTEDAGSYELYYSLYSGGLYGLHHTTSDKWASSAVIDHLSPGTKYYFKVRTLTDPHGWNQNTVVSEYSSVVSGTTTSTAVLSVSDVEVVEGDNGTVNLEFVITLSGSSPDDVWVDWATADGTATAGTDYVAGSGTVHFTSGKSSRPIPVEVMCDYAFEEDETFFLVLSDPVNAVIDDGEGLGTILNDDEAPITVPVAAHIEGVGGTPWRSDLAIANPFDRQMTLQLSYQPGPDTVMTRSCDLPAFGTLLFEDVVQSVFEAGDGRGPLCVEVMSKSVGAPVVASRIFAVRDFGNLGQGITAVSVMDTGSFYLPGLHQDDAFRSNVAVTAGLDAGVTVSFDLYRGDEGLVASGVRRILEPGEQDQWSIWNLFRDMSLPGVPMTVKVTLSAPAITYASLADQSSNDAITYLGKVPRTSWIIPMVAHNPGKEETFWSSIVSMANLGTERATIQLEYLPEKTNNAAGGVMAPDMELGPGETFDLDDPVLQLFGEPDDKGVLIVSSDEPIVVVSRVFTDAETGGTTGHGVRTLPLDALEERELVLPGVRMTDGFRTNVGVVTNERWTTLHFKLRDHEGLQRADEYIMVPPRTVRQWSIDRLFGTEVSMVDPTGSVAVDADGEFVAYLVVVDGSSQDPAFMLPLE